MNERMGLVSIPIEIDEFEKFSWRNAQPHRVKVLEDWWELPPPDTQDRVREFLEFASRRYHIMQSEETSERRHKAVNQRAKRDRRCQWVRSNRWLYRTRLNSRLVTKITSGC